KLYEVNGTQISSSNLSDGSNLAKLNAANTFTNTNLIQLNSATAFQVQNSSNQAILGVDTSNSRIFSGIPNGATAIGFTLNTPSYTTAGAKLLSLQNNLIEKFSVDKDGNLSTAGGLSAGGDISTTGNVNIGSGKLYEVNGT